MSRFCPVAAAYHLIYLAADPTTALLEVQALVRSAHLPRPLPVAPRKYVVFPITVDGIQVVDFGDAGARTAIQTTVQELTGDWRDYPNRRPRGTWPRIRSQSHGRANCVKCGGDDGGAEGFGRDLCFPCPAICDRSTSPRREAMSRAATRARKANALIDALAKLDRSAVLDDLALGRLAREARALIKSDAAGAHTILGGIAGIEGDAARVREHHAIALRLSARDRHVLGNYATALTNVGEMDEAFATIMEAHERYPDDTYVHEGAIGIAVQGARFGEGRALYERWNKLRPPEPRGEESRMRAAAEAVDRGAFSERAAQRVVRLAHEVRLSAGARYAGSSLAAVYGEPDRFGLDMHVHTLPDAAADLNEALANRVVEDDALMSELGLNFVPTFIGTRTHVGDAAATA